MGPRQVGVEEELLLVDPSSGRPRAVAAAVLRHAGQDVGDGPGGTVEAELKQEQIEVDTSPCRSLSDLRREINAARARVAGAAQAVGAAVAALATSPLPAEPQRTANPRYERMAKLFGITEWEHLICGCHVHVSVESPAEGIAVINQVRGWLPVLLAMSANSPFTDGVDTRYASFRSQMWLRWPTAGPLEVFADEAEYDRVIADLVNSGAAMDRGMMYFDARLSEAYPTVEIRVPDVCLEARDTVLVAALVRGLVETAAREAAAGMPPPAWRVDLLRAATWRAGRYGLTGELLDPPTRRLAPAESVVGTLIEHLTPALTDAGDLDTVRDLTAGLLARGTGASRQRAVLAECGQLVDVVRDAVTATAAPA